MMSTAGCRILSMAGLAGCVEWRGERVSQNGGKVSLKVEERGRGGRGGEARKEVWSGRRQPSLNWGGLGEGTGLSEHRLAAADWTMVDF
jgi:hypothetical protein